MITFMLLLPNLVNGACPNKCSGHGKCEEDDVCACKQNWFGGDCSQRKCPYTRAWVDSGNINDPHFYAECANKGSCDRETGICNCDTGYGGSGCRRQTCPNDCSGHGTCEYIEDFTTDSEGQWDEHKIMGCKCDPGYESHDCSSKICPRGDDPLTTGQEKYTELITIVATQDLGSNTDIIFLTYSDPYGNEWTTEAFYPTNCDTIRKQLNKIPNHALSGIVVVDAETTTLHAINSNTGAIAITTANTHLNCKITYPQRPGTTGVQSLSCSYADADRNVKGMQPYRDATTTISTCTIIQVTNSAENTPVLHELATCSNRGLCDGSTGQCECFTGHKGLSCEIQEALF